MSWEDLWPLLVNGMLETLYMVGLAALFTVLIGLPLGVLLFISRRQGLVPMPRLNAVLGAVINTGRSLPFIVLLIALIPFTRLLVGTTLGSTAAIVPIPLGAFPCFAGRKTHWMKWTTGELKRCCRWAAASGMSSPKRYSPKRCPRCWPPPR